MGCKILGFLGFTTVRATSRLQVSERLKPTPSSLTADRIPVARTIPWPLPTLRSSWAAAIARSRIPQVSALPAAQGTAQEQPVLAAAFPQVCRLDPGKQGPGGFPGRELELHNWATSLVWVDLVPFWSRFCPTLTHSKNVVEKHKKKALLSTYTDSLTTSLHALPFSQVQFFHTIDDFTGSVRSPLILFFFLSWRISSLLCWGWSALLPVPARTTAPTSDAVSSFVHMVEADVTAPELKPCSQSVTAICGNGKIFSFSLLTIQQTVIEDSQLSSCDATALHDHRMSGLHTRIWDQLLQTNFQMVTSQAA